MSIRCHNFGWLWMTCPQKLVQAVESTESWPSQSHVMTDGRSLSRSWCQAHSGTYDWILAKKSPSYITADSQSVSPSWCRAPIWTHNLSTFFLDSCGFGDVGRPPWREDESVICSAMTQVQLQVILWPAVCRPVRLAAGPHCFFVSSRCRAPSPISPMNRVMNPGTPDIRLLYVF
jgi:hypothetical protein